MNSTYAIVRFKQPELLMFGVYDISVGYVWAPIFRAKDLKDATIEEIEKLVYHRMVTGDIAYLPEDDSDVDIYIEYEDGIYWQGRASRSAQMITSGASSKRVNRSYGTPDWVAEFLKKGGFTP